jgi:hypothetical protein
MWFLGVQFSIPVENSQDWNSLRATVCGKNLLKVVQFPLPNNHNHVSFFLWLFHFPKYEFEIANNEKFESIFITKRDNKYSTDEMSISFQYREIITVKRINTRITFIRVGFILDLIAVRHYLSPGFMLCVEGAKPVKLFCIAIATLGGAQGIIIFTAQ